MVKITLIFLLLFFKFTVDLLSPIFSTEFIGNDTFPSQRSPRNPLLVLNREIHLILSAKVIF